MKRPGRKILTVLQVLAATAVLALSTQSMTAYAQDVEINETNFPDENFRNWVTENCDGNSDGTLSDDEATDVQRIVVSEQEISDLKGIEYFTGLYYLYCKNNKLTELDVSGNPVLETLDCSNNQLSELYVGENGGLRTLVCSDNQLSELDVSEYPALDNLTCSGNRLISLDLRGNTNLTTIVVSDQKPEVSINDNTLNLESDLGLNMSRVSDVTALNGCTYNGGVITISKETATFEYDYDTNHPDFPMHVTITVHGVLPTYMVNFDVNGGSGSMDPGTTTGNYEFPECGFTAPEGKQFREWNTQADGNGTSYHPGDSFTVSSDTMIYAIWEDSATITNVTISPSSGDVYKNESIEITATVEGTNIPYGGGHDVTWTVTGGTSSDTSISETSTDSSWELHVGTDETASILTVRATSNVDPSVYAESYFTVKERPCVTNLDFFVNKPVAGPGPGPAMTTSTSGITLSGGWLDGDLEEVSSFTLGETYYYVFAVKLDEGYDFPADGAVTVTVNGQTLSLLRMTDLLSGGYMIMDSSSETGEADVADMEGLVPLTAVGTEEEAATFHTVHFDGNGGSGTMSDVTVAVGIPYTLPENRFTAPFGKRFRGWAASESGDVITEEAIEVTTDITFYAIWEDIPAAAYTVRFDSNGGSGTMDAVSGVSGSYTLPANGFTAPAGKQFRGWAARSNGTVISGTRIDVTSNITLYAIWEDIPSEEDFDVRATVTQPVRGAHPSYEATVVSNRSGVKCTAESVTWSPADDPYKASTRYTVTIVLRMAVAETVKSSDATPSDATPSDATPSDAEELLTDIFTGDTTFSINGHPAVVEGFGDNGRTVTISYTFPATGSSSGRHSGGGGGGGGSSSSVTRRAASPASGAWKLDENGWWYKNSDGTWPASAWKLIDSRWYHFGESGYIDYGWYLNEGANLWYYLDYTSGAMKTGWHEDPSDGRWYYLNPTNGDAEIGWQYIDGKWYDFCAMTPDGQTWRRNSAGRWEYIGGRPYASMYENETTPDGYRVDANGAWVQ